MSEIVTDLVVQISSAAAEAVGRHYQSLLSVVQPDVTLEAVCHALDYGYDADLDERTSVQQAIGFDHIGISDVFTRRLEEIIPARFRRGLSNHIYGSDEDQGLFSLFGRPAKPDSRFTGPRRSRASALVQRAIRDCRVYRQAEKATTASEASRMVAVPSPLFVAKQLLGDPLSVGSQTYAAAAVREWAHEMIQEASGEKIDLSFPAVSEAMTLINNRWRTSKPIMADLRANGATVIFICNLLAIEGMAAMRVDLGHLVQQLSTVRDPADSTAGLDEDLRKLWLGTAGSPSEFIINPQFVELPSPSVLLNLIDSLPVPFEGGDIIFQGGIRLSADRSLVAAISGEFGTGKTLFGLALAAGLAPLGCRTLFLSCEESARDIQSRLIENAPRSLFRAHPLFKALDENDFRLKNFEQQGGDGLGLSWFVARQLQVADTAPVKNRDPASGLADLLTAAITEAEIFKPWSDPDQSPLPRFARPVVIIDGLHQLFDLSDSNEFLDASLRRLVETCRSLGAIFLFSFSREWKDLKRMEYLCDLIIEVERSGYDRPAEKPSRTFQLLKARRQPARTGAHLFHIKGDAGFRFKPSVDARVQELKSQLWSAPTDREEIFLTDDPPKDFLQPRDVTTQGNSLPISNHAQILIIGQGSSGKAGFGLYLLHRRWFDTMMIHDHRQLNLPMDRRAQSGHDPLPARKLAILRAKLPVRSDPPYLETRVLVISFLYQQNYYEELTGRLARNRRGKVDRSSPAKYAQIDGLNPFEFTPLPDKLWTDTISLYPGMLSIEDFIAKIDKRLAAAERFGVPYTGVLVDGLHNVFVQFPALEEESSFWGMFYNILRRRRVTVVTTHTEFDINAHPETQDLERHRGAHQIAYNFEQAQRKIAPLLSVLVSGADYLFDLSPSYEARSLVYRLTPRAALGGNVAGLSYAWDKTNLKLESLPTFPSETRRTGPASRSDAAALGTMMLDLMSTPRLPPPNL